MGQGVQALPKSRYCPLEDRQSFCSRLYLSFPVVSSRSLSGIVLLGVVSFLSPELQYVDPPLLFEGTTLRGDSSQADHPGVVFRGHEPTAEDHSLALDLEIAAASARRPSTRQVSIGRLQSVTRSSQSPTRLPRDDFYSHRQLRMRASEVTRIKHPGPAGPKAPFLRKIVHRPKPPLSVEDWQDEAPHHRRGGARPERVRACPRLRQPPRPLRGLICGACFFLFFVLKCSRSSFESA